MQPLLPQGSAIMGVNPVTGQTVKLVRASAKGNALDPETEMGAVFTSRQLEDLYGIRVLGGACDATRLSIGFYKVCASGGKWTNVFLRSSVEAYCRRVHRCTLEQLAAERSRAVQARAEAKAERDFKRAQPAHERAVAELRSSLLDVSVFGDITLEADRFMQALHLNAQHTSDPSFGAVKEWAKAKFFTFLLSSEHCRAAHGYNLETSVMVEQGVLKAEIDDFNGSSPAVSEGRLARIRMLSFRLSWNSQPPPQYGTVTLADFESLQSELQRAPLPRTLNGGAWNLGADVCGSPAHREHARWLKRALNAACDPAKWGEHAGRPLLDSNAATIIFDLVLNLGLGGSQTFCRRNLKWVAGSCAGCMLAAPSGRATADANDYNSDGWPAYAFWKAFRPFKDTKMSVEAKPWTVEEDKALTCRSVKWALAGPCGCTRTAVAAEGAAAGAA
jgi:hypothetical protein